MLATYVAGLAIVAIIWKFYSSGQRRKHLPPGPPTLPVIGNIHQLPFKALCFKFTEWAHQYGGIYSLQLGSRPAVVITDRRLIKEMDRKSSKYSNRPHNHIPHDIMSSGDHLLVMKYGPRWRLFRKVTHQHFMESMVEKYHVEVQDAEATQLMHDLCVEPHMHMKHIKRFGNSIIMSLVFGMRTPTYNTPHMVQLYQLLEDFEQLAGPGGSPPVDIFPFLHWIPQRFLGNWITRSQDLGKVMNDMYRGLYHHVRERREQNPRASDASGSLIDSLLNREDEGGLSEHQMYFLGGVLVEAASETTGALITSFVLAMTKWGDVLSKAQDEMDREIGDDRMPLWEDYSRLPYLAAIIKEIQRWRPVLPIAFPHAVTEDDWLDGYFIPKDTIIFINTWGLHQDSTRFPEPDTFDPDRYLGQTLLAADLAAAANPEARDHYGYGVTRRICPGIHLAERSLFLAISKLVWGFRISPGIDENGTTIEADVAAETAFDTKFMMYAKEFPVSIKPRSEKRRSIIAREFDDAQKVFSRFS